MTAKAETTFYRSIHKLLPSEVYAEKNANPYRGGTPDVYYEGPSDAWFTEYKFVELPKRSTTLIEHGLSPLQLQWLQRAWENGRAPWVVVGCKTGGVLFKHPGQWRVPTTLSEFTGLLKTRQQLAQCITDRAI
jgi:hypothetical protein